MSSRPGFEARTMFVLFQIVSTFFCIVLLLNTVFLPFVCNNIFIYDKATWKRKFLINETWEMKQKYILYCNLYRTSVRYQMIWSYHICIYMIHPYEIYNIWYMICQYETPHNRWLVSFDTSGCIIFTERYSFTLYLLLSSEVYVI